MEGSSVREVKTMRSEQTKKGKKENGQTEGIKGLLQRTERMFGTRWAGGGRQAGGRGTWKRKKRSRMGDRSSRERRKKEEERKGRGAATETEPEQ